MISSQVEIEAVETLVKQQISESTRNSDRLVLSFIAFNSQLQNGYTTFAVEYLRPHSRKIDAALTSELDALKQRIHTQNCRRTDSEHLLGRSAESWMQWKRKLPEFQNFVRKLTTRLGTSKDGN